jgi:hydroxyacylglutathione hydrolase
MPAAPAGEGSPMLLRYFYHQKLAHASYLVGCPATGEAIVIDPGRHAEPYLATAEAEGVRLVAVAETHIHADFVSGSRELAQRTGAKLYLSAEGGPDWQYAFATAYPHCLLRDRDRWQVGNLTFEARHTPGHTPEHLAFLVTDSVAADRPMGIFSGDFVFVGDVGRPDLLEKAAGIADTAEAGARQLFCSLQAFKELPDYLQLWPAHGAGSACGRALGAVPSSTVGYERLFNWALAHEEEKTFVRALLTGQPEPPRYFGRMKRVNREGPPIRHDRDAERLPAGRLNGLLEAGATMVDSRPGGHFASGHIPGTINIPYGRSFPNWAGWLLDYDRPFYLIADPDAAAEIEQDLAYIGLDNLAGYFSDGVVQAWAEAGGELEYYPLLRPEEIADSVLAGQLTVLDVRSAAEFAEGHIPGARHIMLGYLRQRLSELPTSGTTLIHCRTSSRSAIAASLLQASGRRDIANLLGGIRGWAAAGLPLVKDE